jgi:hypothetical protein
LSQLQKAGNQSNQYQKGDITNSDPDNIKTSFKIRNGVRQVQKAGSESSQIQVGENKNV